MLRAMHKQCATHMPDAMHERTNELTNAETTHPERDKAELSNAGARVPGTQLAYLKSCDGCGAEIFMAICRDGRWRPFETERQIVPVPFAWAWRKHYGMEETDAVCGHLIHYCADYHLKIADPFGCAADRKAAG